MADIMNIPGLGELSFDEDSGCFQSKPIEVPVLGGKSCTILVEADDEDEANGDYHTAIANFLSIDESVLRDAAPHVFAYYQDIVNRLQAHDALSECGAQIPKIASPDAVFNHVNFGDEAIVTRRECGDRAVFISIECECDWEIEHGLELVFKRGLGITKVGPYDGHLTNSDAFGDDRYENDVYCNPRRQ